LHEAVTGLLKRAPELSAASGLPAWQRRALVAGLALLGAAALVAPEATLVGGLALMAVPFLCVVTLRSVALWLLIRRGPAAAPGDLPARDDEALPLYTLLIPLFREGDIVVNELIAALRAIDYPADRLEVFLVVESVDAETQDAVRRAPLERHMRVLVVPEGEPRTKPRAIQYALQFAQGDFVVVYDAEDMPEADQLRRALAALNAGERVGCLQAQLNIYNSDATWFTRQFTIEYTALFDCILPALERLRLPVPLGGTSNHFPRAVLDSVGGWDPYNVTEDADLGIRLARSGWHVGVLPSTTWEEAPPSFGVWKGQRTRWLKGWMQTWSRV
jgi:cellulose synthase/poly-beta-1,6-N-acetylglucosamine synthase-like glycosyltransferase